MTLLRLPTRSTLSPTNDKEAQTQLHIKQHLFIKLPGKLDNLVNITRKPVQQEEW